MYAKCLTCGGKVLIPNEHNTIAIVSCDKECNFNTTFKLTGTSRCCDGTIKREYSTDEGDMF